MTTSAVSMAVVVDGPRPFQDHVQEVYTKDEAYLPAEEAPALQGIWFPEAYGHPERTESSGPPPCKGPCPPEPLNEVRAEPE